MGSAGLLDTMAHLLPFHSHSFSIRWLNIPPFERHFSVSSCCAYPCIPLLMLVILELLFKWMFQSWLPLWLLFFSFLWVGKPNTNTGWNKHRNETNRFLFLQHVFMLMASNAMLTSWDKNKSRVSAASPFFLSLLLSAPQMHYNFPTYYSVLTLYCYFHFGLFFSLSSSLLIWCYCTSP